MKEHTPTSDNLDDTLLVLLDEYESLSEHQQTERTALLERIDQLLEKTNQLDEMDEKLEQFTRLILDIRSQLQGVSTPEEDKFDLPTPPPSSNEVVASQEEIKQLAIEVENRSEELDDEIASLQHLLQKRKQSIQEKDTRIEELNNRLEMLSEEKTRLANELENINNLIDSWKNQLEILQKLATSDPRYRVIEGLKKHGALSDIQLAFTMGTSITQLRKYLDDLEELKLVNQLPNGRYEWTGKEYTDAL